MPGSAPRLQTGRPARFRLRTLLWLLPVSTIMIPPPGGATPRPDHHHLYQSNEADDWGWFPDHPDMAIVLSGHELIVGRYRDQDGHRYRIDNYHAFRNHPVPLRTREEFDAFLNWTGSNSHVDVCAVRREDGSCLKRCGKPPIYEDGTFICQRLPWRDVRQTAPRRPKPKEFKNYRRHLARKGSPFCLKSYGPQRGEPWQEWLVLCVDGKWYPVKREDWAWLSVMNRLDRSILPKEAQWKP